MNTDSKEVADALEEKYGFETEERLEDIVDAAFRELAEQELPELQQELERFEGKKFTVLGKIEFLESLISGEE